MRPTVEECFMQLFEAGQLHHIKATDLWLKLQQLGVANTEFNRQKMYRLLYKKIQYGQLIKQQHPENNQLSTYSYWDDNKQILFNPVNTGENQRCLQQKLEEMQQKQQSLQ